MLPSSIEFDGRIAAVAWEETTRKYKMNSILRLVVYGLFLPTRAYGANSARRRRAS
jgi:hypothetical protein